MQCQPADIKQLGTILGIWAHPDDEAWAMAGLIAIARRNQQRVVLITATRGDAGKTANETRWPQTQLGEIRTKELEDCLRLLDVSEHYWLDYEDGGLAAAGSATAVKQLTDIMNDVRPDSVFTFEPNGITGHSDHKTICSWAHQAVSESNLPVTAYGAIESAENYEQACCDCQTILKDIYFNTDKPVTKPMNKMDLCIPLPTDIQDLKLRALKCQPSQTKQLFDDPEGLIFIKAHARCECFTKL
ncbi:MAG: N-acetyl-D-myo-inositol-2-amino-2-deoxy-alpha-D-glucopyranoside deacetylase [Patescibacteria group bacterium]|nr:N-acetyl-D-myo-inositol-2-amino-2-deoxy-alpha-D-glucopyranoside deacetylase [Patescibacteria group bacterium]